MLDPMKLLYRFLAVFGCLVVGGWAEGVAAEPAFVRYDGRPREAALAVKVADRPLVFTGEMFPGLTAGRPTGGAAEQAREVLAKLRELLEEAGTGLTRIVRLGVQVADDRDAALVLPVLLAEFGEETPAVALARTALPDPGMRVSLHAVAVAGEPANSPNTWPAGTAPLARGRRLFISGQAEAARNLADGTRLTLASLGRSLDYLGGSKKDIVQVRAFITPYEDRAALEREVRAFFDPLPIPPLVVTAWISTFPAEIEVIARGGDRTSAATELEFPAFPGLPNSTRFSRACVVPANFDLVFTSTFFGFGSAQPREEMRMIFDQLTGALLAAGGSYQTLVKATYAWTGDEARDALNRFRDVHYAPLRPPAASGVTVATTGQPGSRASLDMIFAVPRADR